MITSFFEMLQYGFIVRAFIAGIIITLCAALIGSSLVLRRQSMIGDGLSHVAFGSAAIATILGLAPLEFSIPIVAISSVFILRLGQKSKINGDAAIAVLSSSALALGTFLISINGGTNIDLNSYLFGSILAINSHDLIICIVLGIIIIFVSLIFRRQIFAITFDEPFARAIGIKVDVYDTILAILCSLVVVIGRSPHLQPYYFPLSLRALPQQKLPPEHHHRGHYLRLMLFVWPHPLLRNKRTNWRYRRAYEPRSSSSLLDI